MDFGTFFEEYETAMQGATDLSAYITYMQLDYLVSVFGYGLTIYSLLFLLTFDADWLWLTNDLTIYFDIASADAITGFFPPPADSKRWQA